jgi:hypothetical protein
MKHSLLILISLILLSSPVISQSSKYESVSQCVLQTMDDRKLTGNKMFEMVKEECERSLGEVVVEKKEKGVLYERRVNGKWEWYKSKKGKRDSKYVGEIENGKPNGQGTLSYLSGTKYVGEYKDGKKNGQGTQTGSDGEKYLGEWKDGKRNGQGTETFPNGSKYVGEWKNGKENGQGTTTFRDGDKYVGEYKNGKTWNGTGYDKDGNILGKMVNGKFIKQ